MTKIKPLIIGFALGFALAIALNTFDRVITVQVQPTVYTGLGQILD